MEEESPSNLFQTLMGAFDPDALRRISKEFEEEPGRYQQILLEMEEMHKSLHGLRGVVNDAFHYHIEVAPKPGHMQPVLHFLNALAEKTSAMVTAGNNGQEACARMVGQLPATDQGLFLLFSLSHCLRICNYRKDIVNVTTALGWSAEGTPHPTAPFESQTQTTGYGLLKLLHSKTAPHFQLNQFREKGINRVETIFADAWYLALKQVMGRPEMFGAIACMHAAATHLYSEVLYNEDLKDYDILASGAKEFGIFAQRAYNQRLQFSPAMSGAPPINGQLPFGVNQLVIMIDGLITSLMTLAPEPDVLKRRQVGDDPNIPERHKSLVIFEADATISYKNILDFGIFQINLIQTAHPIGMAPLFHELGHALILNFMRRSTETLSYSDLNKERDKWIGEKKRLARACLDNQWYINKTMMNKEKKSWAIFEEWRVQNQSDNWEEQITIFIEDIIAHTVWHLVGCHGHFENFFLQFSTNLAMGFREKPEKMTFNSCVQVWAQAATHLYIQKKTGETPDEPGLYFDIRYERGFQNEFERLIEKMRPFFDGEFACLAEREDKPDKDLKKLIRNEAFLYWVPVVQILTRKYRAGEPSCFIGLMREIGNIKKRVNQERASMDTTSIERAISEGLPVTDHCREMINHDGYPGVKAVVYVQCVMNGLTAHLSSLFQKQEKCSLARNRYFEVKQREDGIFTDFMGGIFAHGEETRKDYLRVRLAAMESLIELGNYVTQGPILKRFQNRRAFNRHRQTTETFIQVKKGTRDMKFSVTVIDRSPGGLQLRFRNPCQDLERGDVFSIETLYRGVKEYREFRVCWTDEDRHRHFGAELDFPCLFAIPEPENLHGE